MRTIQQTITVNSPHWAVFTFVADLQNDPLWRTNVPLVRHTGDGPLGIGANYWYVMGMWPFRRTTGLVRLTDFESDRTVEFYGSFESSLQVRVRYDIAQAGEATSMRVTVRPTHSGVARLLLGFASMRLRATLAVDLLRLKRLLEDRRRGALDVWRAMQG